VQKKKEKEEKKKEKGRRPWAMVRELRSIILLREQWRHGSAEGEGEGEGEEEELVHCSST